jgi:predicted Ser/Thr protein kinase
VAIAIGGTVKHYEIESLLGKGGMGVVYRARDVRLGRAVALKVLAEEVTADPERRERFKREAQAACKVNHPAIAQVYDVDEADGGFFLAMELVEGKTVRALVQAKELDLLGALEVAAQVASGLAKAHEAGIVHRDIKPENIVVTPDGHAKILDFGLAKLLEPSGIGKADDLSHMETLARTQAGMILGTLRYMSPEQARGQGVDHRSDIFSLGILIFEMVTGQIPFSGNTPVDTLHAIAFEETRPVTQLRANVPPSLQRVVGRCLRKRPQDRYADAREVFTDLKAVQREVESGFSGRVPLAQRLQETFSSFSSLEPRQWLLPGAVGAGLLALLVFLVSREGFSLAPLLVFAFFGLLVFRRFKNRRKRLLRRFIAKAQRLGEVRVVALAGDRLTVVADQAVARTYVRLNALVDEINDGMYFGEPFTVVVRDDLGEAELRDLFKGPGILYVREDSVPPQSARLPGA